MEKPIEQKPIEKINLSVSGFEESDLTHVETSDGVKSILDVKKIKDSQGATFVSLIDSKEGVVVQVQSFKESLKSVKMVGLKTFNQIRASRTNTRPNYIQ